MELMKITRSVGVAATAGALLVGLLIAPAPATDETHAADPVTGGAAVLDDSLSRGVIDESVRLRGELGLVSDRQLVEQIVQDAGIDLDDKAGQLMLVNEWGFIGTRAEAALIHGREDLMTAIHNEAPGLLSFDGSCGTDFDGSTLVVRDAGATPSQ